MVDIQGIRSLVGRPLKESEQRHIAWINGWDHEAREAFVSLVKEAYWNGAKEGGETVKASTSCMTKRDIQQFAEALAERIKQIYDDHLVAMTAHTNDPTYETAMREAETFAQCRLYSDLVHIFPQEIRQAFYAAYGALG